MVKLAGIPRYGKEWSDPVQRRLVVAAAALGLVANGLAAVGSLAGVMSLVAGGAGVLGGIYFSMFWLGALKSGEPVVETPHAVWFVPLAAGLLAAPGVIATGVLADGMGRVASAVVLVLMAVIGFLTSALVAPLVIIPLGLGGLQLVRLATGRRFSPVALGGSVLVLAIALFCVAMGLGTNGIPATSNRLPEGGRIPMADPLLTLAAILGDTTYTVNQGWLWVARLCLLVILAVVATALMARNRPERAR